MSSKGTSHFVAQRITALILIPLVIWLIIGLLSHIGASREEVYHWLSNKFVAVPMAVLILAMFFHMRLGMQEVIDDYIHKPDTKSMLTFLNTLFVLIIGAAALWSVLSITITA